MKNSLEKKLILIFLLSSAVIFLVFHFFYFPEYHFESEKWKLGDKRVRGSMVRELEERKILIGKTRQEIKRILGKPDTEGKYIYQYFVDVGVGTSSYPWDYAFDIEFDSTSSRVVSAFYHD
jgi:hypothetical protein